MPGEVRGRKVGGGVERRRAQAAQRRTRLEGWGQQGTRGKRTWNMPHMFVTLDVSKLSGWLNAYANCRESKGGRICGSGRGAGRKAGGCG